jgi:nitroreductase
VDAYLAIASQRAVRAYDGRPIPEDVVTRILDSGRLAGSAVNRQAWRFLIVESPSLRQRLAASVYVPTNISGAALVVAVVVSGKGPIAFDAGRAAQNMMLAAWNDGVGSCPNSLADDRDIDELLGLRDGEKVQTILSFGYPAKPRDPESRPATDWSARANRRPLAETVRRA